MHHRRFIDPNRETNRKPQIIIAKRAGQMVHVDVTRSRSSLRWSLACPRGVAPNWPNDRGAEERGTGSPASITPIFISRST